MAGAFIKTQLDKWHPERKSYSDRLCTAVLWETMARGETCSLWVIDDPLSDSSAGQVVNGVNFYSVCGAYPSVSPLSDITTAPINAVC